VTAPAAATPGAPPPPAPTASDAAPSAPPPPTTAPGAPPAPPAIAPAIDAPPSSTGAGSPTTTLLRTEVNAALADFGALASSFDATFTPAGLRLDAVTAGSLFAKAGLRKGDVIATVDGQPLRSIDDAADLYARAGTLQHATVQLLRAGKPLALRVVIR
jgi:membrane-associated protease RseP (regulator of RpoE activity)